MQKLKTHEREAVTRSLADPTLRAASIISGVLLDLPSVEHRRAVISFVLSTVAAPSVVPAIVSGGPAVLGRLHDGNGNDSGE